MDDKLRKPLSVLFAVLITLSMFGGFLPLGGLSPVGSAEAANLEEETTPLTNATASSEFLQGQWGVAANQSKAVVVNFDNGNRYSVQFNDTFPTSPSTVRIDRSKDIAYVFDPTDGVDGRGGFIALDISDKTNPSVLYENTTFFGASGFNVRNPDDFEAKNGYLYVSDQGKGETGAGGAEGSLRIFDASPILNGSAPTKEYEHYPYRGIRGIDFSSEYPDKVYATANDASSDGSYPEAYVYGNATDPANASVDGTLNVPNVRDQTRIDIHGNLLLINNDGSYSNIDGDESRSVYVHTLDSPTSATQHYNIDGVKSLSALTDEYIEAGSDVYDVSNRSNPIDTGSSPPQIKEDLDLDTQNRYTKTNASEGTVKLMTFAPEVQSISTGGSVSTMSIANDGDYLVYDYDHSSVKRVTKNGTIEWNTSIQSTTSPKMSVGSDNIYVYGDSHQAAVNKTDGTLVWEQSHSFGTVSGGTVGVNHLVLAGFEGNTIPTYTDYWGLNKSDGTIGWNTQSSHENNGVRDKPVYDSDTGYFVVDNDNYLEVRDATDGSLIWSDATNPSPGGNQNRDYKPPTLTNGTIIEHTGDYIHAYDLNDGSRLWSMNATDGGINDATVESQIVSDEQYAYGLVNGSLSAIDAGTGEIKSQESSLSDEWGDAVVGSEALFLQYSASDGEGSIKVVEKSNTWQTSQINKSVSIHHTRLHSGDLVYGVGGSDIVRESHPFVSSSADWSGADGGADNTNNGLGVFAISTSGGVSGYVQTTDGDRVPNATVVAVAVNYNQITPKDWQTKQERAQELLQKAEDPLAPSWNPDLELTGSNGELASTNTIYPVIHEKDDWGVGRVETDAKLSNPVIRLKPDTEYVFSIWNPQAGGTLENSITHPAASDLIGAPVNGTVKLTKLGPSGDVTTSTKFGTTETYDVRAYRNGDSDSWITLRSHKIAIKELPPGVYKLSASTADSEKSLTYTVVVAPNANPTQLRETIQTGLENEAGNLSNRAEYLRQKYQNNKFKRVVTRTDSNGEFQVDIGSNYKTVSLSAYKSGDYIMQDVSVSSQPTLNDFRSEIKNQQYNGSVYFSTETEKVSPPASNVPVEVREFKSPTQVPLSDFFDKLDWLNKFFDAESYTEALGLSSEPLPKINESTAEERADEIKNNIINNNDDAEQTYQDLKDKVENISDTTQNLTNAQGELKLSEQTIQMLADELETGQVEQSINETAVTVRIPFESGSVGDVDLKKSQTIVYAKFPNGTTEVVDESNYEIQNSIGEPAEVVVTYPMGSDTPAVTFDVVTTASDGGEDKLGKEKVTVDNPRVDGEPPKIDSVDFSTLRPTDDSTVSLTVNPDESSSFRRVKSATVYDSSGNLVNSTVSNGEVSFTTGNAGVHIIDLTYETVDGQVYTQTLRLEAGTTDYDMPTSVRVSQSSVGTFAMTGDGVESADVEVKKSGKLVVAPSLSKDRGTGPVHIYTADSGSDDYTVRLLDSQQNSLGQYERLVIHSNKFDASSSFVYVNGKPVTGNLGHGAIEQQADATLLKTYTDDTGAADVRVITDPSFTQEVSYTFDVYQAKLNLGSLPVVGDFL